MDKDLVIDVAKEEIQIALLEDKQLVELHKEGNDAKHSVGDIYLGKVKKIMHGLNAAFIDIASNQDAFLHYLDLGPQYLSLSKFLKRSLAGDKDALDISRTKLEPSIEKNGKISSTVKPGQFILVQVIKEPISTKGPKVSSDISFAGRYIILLPFSDKISISQKIKSVEERNRLKRLAQSILPNNFGIIIRTVAEGKSVADLDADLHSLLSKWEMLCQKLTTATFPQKIISEQDKTLTLLRDILTDDFNNIYVNNAELCGGIKSYLQTIAPAKVDILKHYKLSTPIFEQFGVQKQIKNAFGKMVTMRHGVYLIIEHTEAMHVIDVNSGNHAKSGDNQEETALMVNMEAAEEISRQLRLRDMGGIIVVDFIDMYLLENRRTLYKKLVEEMAKDKAKHTILPPSKFGLVQITRQRVRPQVNVLISEQCPTCMGSGTIKSSIIVVDEIAANLDYLLIAQNEKNLTLLTHPYIHAYLTKGFPSIQWKWFMKFKKWIKIQPIDSHAVLQYS